MIHSKANWTFSPFITSQIGKPIYHVLAIDLTRHPKLYSKFIWFVGHILYKSTPNLGQKQLLINTNVCTRFITILGILNKSIPYCRYHANLLVCERWLLSLFLSNSINFIFSVKSFLLTVCKKAGPQFLFHKYETSTFFAYDAPRA